MQTTKITRMLSLLVLLTMLFPAGAALADTVSAPPKPQTRISTLISQIADRNSANSALMASKTASVESGAQGETVTYTLVLESTAPITNAATISDTIPEGLTYVPDSLEASSGDVDASNAPELSWSGTLSDTDVVTLTYAVSITAASAQVVTNTAVFEVEENDPMTRTAAIEVVSAAGLDLTPSSKTASVTKADVGDEVTYTVVVANANGSFDATALMSDTLPQGLVYVTDSMTATEGTVDDSAAPELFWTGSLSPTGEITITYTAVVTYITEGTNTAILPPRLVNHATITADDQTVVRSVTITTADFTVYMPLVVKSNQ